MSAGGMNTETSIIETSARAPVQESVPDPGPSWRRQEVRPLDHGAAVRRAGLAWRRRARPALAVDRGRAHRDLAPTSTHATVKLLVPDNAIIRRRRPAPGRPVPGQGLDRQGRSWQPPDLALRRDAWRRGPGAPGRRSHPFGDGLPRIPRRRAGGPAVRAGTPRRTTQHDERGHRGHAAPRETGRYRQGRRGHGARRPGPCRTARRGARDLGPNGAGKTTFVRTVATLLRPTSGELRVRGSDVVRDPVSVRRDIGLAGQFAAVEPTMTGRENLEMTARLFGHPGSAARRAASIVIEQLSLAEVADRRCSTYSGGQRRRLDRRCEPRRRT